MFDQFLSYILAVKLTVVPPYLLDKLYPLTIKTGCKIQSKCEGLAHYPGCLENSTDFEA